MKVDGTLAADDLVQEVPDGSLGATFIGSIDVSVGKDLVVYNHLLVELGAMSYDNPFVGDVSLHVGGDVRGPAAEDVTWSSHLTTSYFMHEIGNNFTGGIAVSIDGSVRANKLLSRLALKGWSKLRGDVTLTIGGPRGEG